MNYTDELLAEFDEEMAATRRVLERVPDDKAEWKPHPKSFSLGHLAQLLSWMPGWITNTLHETRLDLSAAARYSIERTTTLLAAFDQNVQQARAAIAAAQPADYDVEWSLTHGDNVLFKAGRKKVVRQTISHLSHHRGQMTVYLRLLDVPVPSIYGPTADEGWGS